MFTKKVLKKLIDRYKLSYVDISNQLSMCNTELNAQHRYAKVIKDDYKLKITVLESILNDVNTGCIDGCISLQDIEALLGELNINVSDTNTIKCESTINTDVDSSDNAKCVTKDTDNIVVKKEDNIFKNNVNVVENKYIPKEKDSSISYTDTNSSSVGENKDLVCTFKGYGYKDLYGYDTDNEKYVLLNKRIENLLVKLIEEKGVTTFITGGSLGFDKMVYYIVDNLKSKYPHIKNKLALPFLSQDSNWSDNCKVDYRYMKYNADDLIYVDNIDEYNTTNVSKGSFHKDKLRIAHEYMIDNSDVLVVLYRGEGKNAISYCIDYANKQKLKGVLTINPGM